MYQRFIPLAVIALMLSGSTAFAQCACSYVATANYVAPVAPSYVSYYAPPAVDITPAPYVSYYAPPVAVAPAPYVSYYAPAVSYATYYSPRVAYAPVVTSYAVRYGVPGWSIYGTPRVYVPAEPVRNVVRAVTP
jgi:hypothetical protein